MIISFFYQNENYPIFTGNTLLKNYHDAWLRSRPHMLANVITGETILNLISNFYLV